MWGGVKRSLATEDRPPPFTLPLFPERVRFAVYRLSGQSLECHQSEPVEAGPGRHGRSLPGFGSGPVSVLASARPQHPQQVVPLAKSYGSLDTGPTAAYAGIGPESRPVLCPSRRWP